MQPEKGSALVAQVGDPNSHSRSIDRKPQGMESSKNYDIKDKSLHANSTTPFLGKGA